MQDSESLEINEGSEGLAKKIEIQKIYVRDISFESPATPQIFNEQRAPRVSQELSNSHVQLSDFVFESTLTVTITVHIDDKVAYLAEVKQAGIFNIIGHPPEGTERALSIFCPTVLFPYARETISDLSARGGFPSLVLQHMNFHSMYHEYQKKMEDAQMSGGDDTDSH